VDGNVHITVTLSDDPDADIQRGGRPGGQRGRAIASEIGHHFSGLKRGHMLTRLIKAAVLAALVAAVIQSLPDIKRYLELREM